MMNMEEYLQRRENIRLQKKESKEREYDETQAAMNERNVLLQALEDARQAYIRRYRQEVAKAKEDCDEKCRDIRLREQDFRARLQLDLLKLESEAKQENDNNQI